MSKNTTSISEQRDICRVGTAHHNSPSPGGQCPPYSQETGDVQIGTSPLTQLANDSEKTYCCPGDPTPISRAVHLGRLASGYAPCTECAWARSDVADNLAPTTELQPTPFAIRRTPDGFRGPYINAIDRSKAGWMAAMLASHLVSLQAQDTGQPDETMVVQGENPSDLTIAVGYGGHRGAPDIFSGVVSAVQQNGCNVIDAGRCTAVSLLHAVRSQPNVRFAMMVTGADAPSADIGIDILCEDGRSLAIPWQDFGVSVATRQLDRESQKANGLQPNAAEWTLTESTLQLPDSIRGFAARSHRHNGHLSTIPSEEQYRQWLRKWWPAECHQGVVFQVADEFDVKRIEWLVQGSSLNLEIRRRAGTDSQPRDRRIHFELNEDDRFLNVHSRRGRRLSTDEIANWINETNRTFAPHLTAHNSADGGKILLYDVAPPESGNAQQIITDGLVVAGLLLGLLQKNPLPA